MRGQRKEPEWQGVARSLSKKWAELSTFTQSTITILGAVAAIVVGSWRALDWMAARETDVETLGQRIDALEGAVKSNTVIVRALYFQQTRQLCREQRSEAQCNEQQLQEMMADAQAAAGLASGGS